MSDTGALPSSPALPTTPVRVGVFDSGVGGLSVLRAIRGELPHASLIYVADSAHAPYGERDEAYVVDRSLRIATFLKAQQVDAIVVACNTATAAAVHALRARWPDFPIIGVEPGIKPALAQSANRRVGVMAPPGTLASLKFKALVAQHTQGDASLVLQACPGLAREIEHGALDRPELRALAHTFCEPLRQAGVDTVVLGCTHYPFIRALLQHELGPDVTLLDTAEAVARRTASLLQSAGAAQPVAFVTDEATTSLWTTGQPAHLDDIARNWLGWHLQAQHLEV